MGHGNPTIYPDTVFGDPEIGSIILQFLYTASRSFVSMISYSIGVKLCMTPGAIGNLELRFHPAKTAVE